LTFFVTRHGKSPCDGVGGTAKRKLVNESLSQPRDNEILNATNAFVYCDENIKGIKFFFPETEEVSEIKYKLKERFSKGSTIPDTQAYRYFFSSKIGSKASNVFLMILK